MQDGSRSPSQIADLERQVAVLADLVLNLIPLLGAMNATIGRLGAGTPDYEIYDARFDELDKEIQRLATEIEETWPPMGEGP